MASSHPFGGHEAYGNVAVRTLNSPLFIITAAGAVLALGYIAAGGLEHAGIQLWNGTHDGSVTGSDTSSGVDRSGMECNPSAQELLNAYDKGYADGLAGKKPTLEQIKAMCSEENEAYYTGWTAGQDDRAAGTVSPRHR